ncbi:MAG TPA: hypothetical protein VGD64_11705 [Acidisarcina sp.]
MLDSEQVYGKLNPAAPAELSRFAFLVGNWRCEAKLESADGVWQTYEAAWQGRFILDGYAIADEYRMMGESGELIVLGMNIRTYDAAKQAWNIRWLNGLAGDWTNLVSEDLGGVRIEGRSITYAFQEPAAAHSYTRATYTDHSATHFTWRGDQSEDCKSWRDFMTVDAHRDA